MYFSYDPNGEGMRFFDTEEEAKDDATNALEAERDIAAEGWSEEVTEICWGKVSERVILTEEKPAPPESGFDGYSNYGLKPA